jgi:hypothetical protein
MTGGTYFICSSGISGKFAKQLDNQLDDGNTNAGSMKAGPTADGSTAGTATADIVDTTDYVVCMGI